MGFSYAATALPLSLPAVLIRGRNPAKGKDSLSGPQAGTTRDDLRQWRPWSLHGKGKFPQNVPDKIISFLKGEIKVKPAPNQYADYFFYSALFYHAG